MSYNERRPTARGRKNEHRTERQAGKQIARDWLILGDDFLGDEEDDFVPTKSKEVT